VAISLAADGKVQILQFTNAIVRSTPRGPEPGTEAALRRYIAGFSKGQPDYDDLTPEMADGARKHGTMADIMKDFQPMGALQSLTFQKVTVEGLDQYEAVYAHGRVTFTMGPLVNGKMQDFGFTYSDPKNRGIDRGLMVRHD